MFTKQLAWILLLCVIILTYLYWSETYKYPVTKYVCSAGYNECSPVAKFESRESCEYSNEMSGWRCDSTNKNDIKCYEPSNSFATGYCK